MIENYISTRITKSQIKSSALTSALFFLFLLFLKPSVPDSLAYFGLSSALSPTTWNVIATAIAFVLMAIYFKNIGLDLFGGLILLFFAVIALATMSNMGDLTFWTTENLPCIALCLFTAVLWKRNAENLLKGAMAASVFFLLINLFFFFAEGNSPTIASTDAFFYGYRNITFRIAIPAFTCSLLLDSKERRKPSVRSWIIFALSVFEMLVAYSATSICGILIMGAIVALSRFRVSRHIFNGITGLTLYVVAFVSVVVFRVQNYFGFIFEGILGRSVTFTGRTLIWDEAFRLLDGVHWLKGFGESYIWNALTVDDQIFMHAHNEMLHIIMLGGLPALAVFATVLGLVAYLLYSRRDAFGASCLSAALFTYLVIGISEVTLFPSSFFILAVMYYSCRYNLQPDSVNLTHKNAAHARHARLCYDQPFPRSSRQEPDYNTKGRG